MNKEKNVFGLTGNMGCGKSTVGEFLRQHSDIYFFDSDKVSKEILDKNENLDQIRSILGNEIVVDGKINRKKVSQIIFNNPEKKQSFENFLHPKVWEKLFETVKEKGSGTMVVVESAILYEIKGEEQIGKMILVTCDKEEQFRRIRARNGWSDEEIEERLRSQLPSEIKEPKSWAVIDTHCSLEELKAKVELLYQQMKNGSDQKVRL